MNKPATEIMFEMLVRNLEAWEGEEDSVKEEHAELIEDTRRMVDSYLVLFRGSQGAVPVVTDAACLKAPSSNSDNSSELLPPPWLED